MRYLNLNPLILFFFLLFISLKSLAQVDASPGAWRMEYLPDAGSSPINIELRIASPEKNILFPAQLKLQCDGFSAEYELLLVKKTTRELAISKMKYPVTENPFSLGNSTGFLNGTFEYSNGVKGIPTLTAIRIESKAAANGMADTMHLDKAYKTTAIRLVNFLRDADITLKKVNDTPWDGEGKDHILSPSLSPVYFGLLDTVHLQEQNGTLALASNKKPESDIVSIGLNGSINESQIALTRKEYTDDIYLDTGLNLVALFAENFGNETPNKGRLNLAFGNKKLALDFANKADSAATFIVAQLYCDHDKTKDKDFENYTVPEKDTLKKEDKLLGSIVSTSRQLTFAIWDDAVEDGDSISININGSWLVHGFPVKTKPQFVTVTLKPGPNVITYIADNLGSIPPNTSVLEIIDGIKRRPFTIETNLGENNLIKIFYDVSAQ